ISTLYFCVGGPGTRPGRMGRRVGVVFSILPFYHTFPYSLPNLSVNKFICLLFIYLIIRYTIGVVHTHPERRMEMYEPRNAQEALRLSRLVERAAKMGEQGMSRVPAEVDASLLVSLPQHRRLLPGQVHVTHSQLAQFGSPNAGIQQQQENSL